MPFNVIFLVGKKQWQKSSKMVRKELALLDKLSFFVLDAF